MLPCPPPVVERLTYVAKSKSLDVGDLLGVIMAHEIGHLSSRRIRTPQGSWL